MAGHIRLRGELDSRGRGRWLVVVDHGRDALTKRRRQAWETVRGTHRDAEIALRRMLADRERSAGAPAGRLTVAQFLERWLRAYAEPNTSRRTYLRYEQLVRNQLVPGIGRMALKKLEPVQIQETYGKLLLGGLAQRTVLHCHRLLSEALSHAVEWGLLGRNPAGAVRAPRVAKTEIRPPGPADVKRLLEAADALSECDPRYRTTDYGALVLVAVQTGLRAGEMLGLRWTDIDLEGGVAHIQQAAHWLPGQGFTVGQPKTAKSRRAVSLTAATVACLGRHRQRQAEDRLMAGPAYQESGLVFTTAIGTPLANLRRAWVNIVKAAGVGHVRFHDLRHAHATMLLTQGVHPKIVSERLGHSAIAITLDTYSHVLPSLQAEAVADLDRLLELEATG